MWVHSERNHGSASNSAFKIEVKGIYRHISDWWKETLTCYIIHSDTFSRMRSEGSEGFPFIVWGSGGWTLVRLECLVGSSSGR